MHLIIVFLIDGATGWIPAIDVKFTLTRAVMILATKLQGRALLLKTPA